MVEKGLALAERDKNNSLNMFVFFPAYPCFILYDSFIKTTDK